MLTGAVRRARLGLACLLALTLPLALSVITTVSPARADSVRSAQDWVLAAVNAPAAWNVTKGQGVIVAVIDSGVNPAVSDLTGSVITGPDLTGVGTPSSDAGWGMHGTWMASLIAGHGHNGGGDGITGIAPQARVLSVRVITDKTDPGYARYEREPPSRGQRQLAKAIRYAVSHGAGVISMSLGYSTPSRIVRSALQDALDHDVVVVASSGNMGDAANAGGKGHAPYSFPAVYPGVLGVAAVNQAGRPAVFSSENLSVQVAAPGVDVPAQGTDGQYWLVSGTSPACALTAGVAALIRSRFPALAPAMVRQAITGTTRSRPAGGYDDQVGFGTIDAAAALTDAGRLAGQVPHGRGLPAAGRFGGGPPAVSPVPISPRGEGTLVLLCLLGAGCLALVVAAARRLVMARRGPLRAWEGGAGMTARDGPLPWHHPAGPGRPNGAHSGGAHSGGAHSDGPHSDGVRPDGVHSGGGPQGWRPDDGARTSVLPRFTWQPGPTGRHVARPDQGAAEDGE
jgi:subtilisin family serine protease